MPPPSTIRSPELLVDLGHGVMDAAMVEAAAYVLAKPNAA